MGHVSRFFSKILPTYISKHSVESQSDIPLPKLLSLQVILCKWESPWLKLKQFNRQRFVVIFAALLTGFASFFLNRKKTTVASVAPLQVDILFTRVFLLLFPRFQPLGSHGENRAQGSDNPEILKIPKSLTRFEIPKKPPKGSWKFAK